MFACFDIEIVPSHYVHVSVNASKRHVNSVFRYYAPWKYGSCKLVDMAIRRLSRRGEFRGAEYDTMSYADALNVEVLAVLGKMKGESLS